MELNILGPLEVRLDGAVIDLGAPKQRAVLAFLAAHAGRPVSLDQLIEELWGDQAPPRATASLQAYVSNLRRLLEPDRAPRTPARLLVSRPPGYALDLPPGALDADRFDTLVDEIDTAVEHGDVDRAIERSKVALGLWRGGVLDDFAYEPFVTDLRARLDARLVHLHELRARALLDAGRARDAATELDQLTRAHPLHERLWELQMLALYRDGRQADALRAFQEARAVLADELGLDPGPDLRRIEQQILDHDPALGLAAGTPPTPRPVDAPAPNAPPPEARLVGRTAELGQLRDALDEAATGRTTFVLVAGEAGIGKTALLEALTPIASAAGAAVHIGHSLELAGSAPLWPWQQVVRSLLGADPARSAEALIGPRAAALDPMLPGEIAGPVPVAAAERSEPPDTVASQLRFFDAVRALLEASAAATPLVVALEDLHWADRDTLRLLDFVAAELRHAPVVLIGTYRDDEALPGSPLGEALGSLARQGAPLRITLRGLDREALAAFAGRLVGGTLDEQTVDLIEAQTNGNPFFVGELVRLLASERRLDGDRARSEVPTSVRDVVRRRIGRLPEDSQAVLRVAALIGHEIPFDVLAEACELDFDHLLDALEPPLLSGLLTESGASGDRYRFAHALVAATLADDLAPPRRRRLHARIGAAIESVHRLSIDRALPQLAFHYGQAASLGHAAAAASYAEQAARQADAGQALAEAARFWQLAHDTLALDPAASPEHVVDVSIELATALTRTAEKETREVVVEAMDRALALGDVRRATRAAMALARHDTTWGWADFRVVHRDVVARIEAAIELAGPADTPERARLLSVVAFGTYYEDPGRADAISAEGLTVARMVGDEELLGECLALRICHLQNPHQAEELIETATELIELGRHLGLVRVQAIGLAGRLSGRFLLGEVEGADADHAAAMALLAVHPIPTLEQQLLLFPPIRLAMVGDFEAAEQAAGLAYEKGRQGSMWLADAQYLTQVVDIRREQERLGELDEAIAMLAADPAVGVANLTVAAALQRGDPDEARRRYEANGGIVPVHHDWRMLGELVYAVDVAVAMHDVQAGHELYDVLRPYRGGITLSGTTVSCNGPVDLFLGRLALAIGDTDAATGHLRDALGLAVRVGAEAWEAHARVELGVVLRAGPDRAAGEAEIERGVAIAARLGMPRPVGIAASTSR